MAPFNTTLDEFLAQKSDWYSLVRSFSPALGPQLELTTEEVVTNATRSTLAALAFLGIEPDPRVALLPEERANCSHQAIAAPGRGSTGASEASDTDLMGAVRRVPACEALACRFCGKFARGSLQRVGRKPRGNRGELPRPPWQWTASSGSAGAPRDAEHHLGDGASGPFGHLEEVWL